MPQVATDGADGANMARFTRPILAAALLVVPACEDAESPEGEFGEFEGLRDGTFAPPPEAEDAPIAIADLRCGAKDCIPLSDSRKVEELVQESAHRTVKTREAVRALWVSVAGGVESDVPGLWGDVADRVRVLNGYLVEVGLKNCVDFTPGASYEVATGVVEVAESVAVVPDGFPDSGAALDSRVELYDDFGMSIAVDLACDVPSHLVTLEYTAGHQLRKAQAWYAIDGESLQVQLISTRGSVSYTAEASTSYGHMTAQVVMVGNRQEQHGARAHINADTSGLASVYLQQMSSKELYKQAEAFSNDIDGLEPSGSALCVDYVADKPVVDVSAHCPGLSIAPVTEVAFGDHLPATIGLVARPAGLGGIIDALNPHSMD